MRIIHKFQYFGHLMQRADSLEKTLMLGKTEGKRKRGWRQMKWLGMNLSQLWDIAEDREAWRAAVLGLQRVRHSLVTEQQPNFLILLKKVHGSVQKMSI